MDESTLINQLRSLESAWGSLDHWLRFWIALVVIGVAMEVVVVIIEYRHERRAFLRGIVRPPDKPSIWLFGFGLLGAGLVAIGVAGEFWTHINAGKIESDMREANRRLVAIINERARIAEADAARANQRASEEEKEAAGLRKEAEEIRASLAPRRLDEKQQKAIGAALMPFAGEFALMLYPTGDREAEIFANDIWVALGKAHWTATKPGGMLSSKEVGTVLPPGTKPALGPSGIELTPTVDDASMGAAKAFAAEFAALGFDCHLDKPDANPKSGHRVQVFVVTRPLGLQGEAKLRAEVNKRRQASTQASSR